MDVAIYLGMDAPNELFFDSFDQALELILIADWFYQLLNQMLFIKIFADKPIFVFSLGFNIVKPFC
jgi:hypothetical protein